jgi:hypothetical protein
MPQVLLPLAAFTEIATVHKNKSTVYGDAAADLFTRNCWTSDMEVFLWTKKDSSCMKILQNKFQPKNS